MIAKYYPLWRPMTWPANFTGSSGYCAVAPTANVTLNIGYLRGGVNTVIGTMTFYAGTQIAFFSPQSAFTTQTGDILTVMGPNDATMAGIGITLLGTVG